MATKHTTYCRICSGFCGLAVEVEDNRVVKVKGDSANPLTGGYTCTKGRHIGDLHADPTRFLECQKRSPTGELEPIDGDAAIEEVGRALRDIVDRYGPDSVALYWGTYASMVVATRPWANALWKAIGSRKWFSTMTIDQAPKWVAPGRIGQWMGGRQRFADSDVWVFIGLNPLVSMMGGIVTGFSQTNGSKRLREAKRRGMRTIVIDPRATETASSADVHLQILPGSDTMLLAGMLKVILDEELEDADFCERWVEDLDALRTAVAPAVLELVTEQCGVEADDVVRAARMFAGATKGMVSTGTGGNMGPSSNLVEHLAWCLNIVCGRFAREGDVAYTQPLLAAPPPPPRAQVVPPDRAWESGYQSRFGYGLVWGELPTMSLPDEIVEPADDRVRALIVIGGNPASSLPDQQRAVDAFAQLDLLVTIDPFPSPTARIADYVLAPTMQLERPEHTGPLEYHVGEPFAIYAAPVLEPAPGVREDWQYLAGIGAAMGLTLEVLGTEYAPEDPLPTPDEMLETLAASGPVPLAEVKQHPRGRMYDDREPVRVLPAEDESGRFRLVAPDVAIELADALTGPNGLTERPFLLAVRRTRESMNSTGTRLEGLLKRTHNPCFMNPGDMESLGLATGELVRMTSDAGAIVAIAEADPRTRPGVVSMSHGYGDLPGLDDDPRQFGANPNRLLSAQWLQPIVGMPRMTGVPISVEPVAVPDPAPSP